MIKPIVATAFALLFSACTPGAAGLAGPSGGVGTQARVVDVNLTLHSASQTPAGMSSGYAPAVVTVAVGSALVFTNSDGFAHTVTLIPGAGAFPAGTPFSASAQTQTGSVVSQNWSSGTLQTGQSSQTISVDRAGTYLYGCFFHYGAPMRGTIVAQ